MARPFKDIDWEELDKLCFMQCTLNEIAAWFDCSIDTIERRVKKDKDTTFGEYHHQKSMHGRISLRRKMFQGAMAGDIRLMVWLSKQHLDMSEKVDKVVMNVRAPERIEKLAQIQNEILEMLNEKPIEIEAPKEGLLATTDESPDNPEAPDPTTGGEP